MHSELELYLQQAAIAQAGSARPAAEAAVVNDAGAVRKQVGHAVSPTQLEPLGLNYRAANLNRRPYSKNTARVK